MTTDREIATAADYADAMLTARRAKNVLGLLLILLLMGQIAIFFIAKYTDLIFPAAATQPAATTQPVVSWTAAYHWAASGCLFLGVTASILLSFVLLLIVNIMLVGRLIGLSRVVSAYCWCLVIMLGLFPWQAFLNNVNLTPDQATFKLPGVLYTWDELAHPDTGARFRNEPLASAIQHWTRFVGAPAITLILLLGVQIKSNRGIRQALGEEEAIVTEPPNP